MIPAGLLFDFNGTLFFDNSLNDQAWNQLARQLRGFPFSEEEQRSFVRGKSNAAAVRRILGKDTSDTDCAKYSEQKEEIYLSLCRNLQAQGRLSLAPGAAEFLDAAKALGYPVNIATSAQPGNVDYYFSAFGLDRWFDREKVSCLLPGIPGKPAPDLYLRAAAAMGVDAKDCWVLEDAASGIQSAKNAGAAKIIAIGEGEEARQILRDNPLVEQVISDFREVALPKRRDVSCG